MNLPARLAYNQLKVNKRRTFFTLAGIIISTAMMTAVCGFASSGDASFAKILGDAYTRQGFYRTTIISVAAFLLAVAAIASVIVISNAFRVSASERVRQFGILKSVGATKRQIKNIVIYESFWLSLPGIPLGIASGLLIAFLALKIANHLLTGLNNLNFNAENTEKLVFDFAVSLPALLLSLGGAFLAVLLSAWLPARKAAKIPAIDAIRLSGEVKLKARQVRTGYLTRRLFGFEGLLAAKALKRSRRNFRATVASLTISIVLLLTASSFTVSARKMTEMFYPDIDVQVVGEFFIPRGPDAGATGFTLDSRIAEDITAKLREFPDSYVFGGGSADSGYTAAMPREMLTEKMRRALAEQGRAEREEYALAVTLLTVDQENYRELCQKAGVSPGENILLNNCRYPIAEKRSSFTPFVYSGQTLTLLKEKEAPLLLPLHGALNDGEIPLELSYSGAGDITVVTPNAELNAGIWFVKTEKAAEFIEYAEKITAEALGAGNESEVRIRFESVKEVTDAMLNMNRVIIIFIYGFVGMLLLISLTNVISTVSANIRSRAREFAVLQSVGMTPEGLKKMLNLESVLCSFRSLALGLPLGSLASWLIYNFFMGSVVFAHEYPWLTAFQCIIGILVITWVTMRHAVTRLRGGNIIETIRAGSGI